jgi:hypothetical protein
MNGKRAEFVTAVASRTSREASLTKSPLSGNNGRSCVQRMVEVIIRLPELKSVPFSIRCGRRSTGARLSLCGEKRRPRKPAGTWRGRAKPRFVRHIVSNVRSSTALRSGMPAHVHTGPTMLPNMSFRK